MNIINILGINISTLNKQGVLNKIERFLNDGKKHQIVTPNPEFMLRAMHDEEFFYILNNADLAIPDGIGLKFTGWLLGKNLCRITGADLVKDILENAKCKMQNVKVGVVNWKQGLSKKEDIEKVLLEKYPGLHFKVQDIDRAGKIVNLDEINRFAPDILFVALGAPYQEKFIYHTLVHRPSQGSRKQADQASAHYLGERGDAKLSSVKLAIGVGGAFDFLTGKIKRAPKFLRIIGLEWLWRLIKQPWRIKRIYNAVIVFPWKFFLWRFVLPFLYRPNVACLLYKKENGRYYILLAERVEEIGHWQLPQGGTDGEDIKTAGTRELSEELHSDKFNPIASFNNLYKYKFGEKLSKFGPLTKTVLGYKGQKQGLFIAKFTGQNSDINIDFWEHSAWKWVVSENLVDEVHSIRKKAAAIFLEKFNSIDK